MSVDLPAPFSPTRAWTRPRCSVKSTPARATTPANALRMPRISSRAASPIGRSGSVSLVEELPGVGGVEEAVLDQDAGRHLLAGQVALQGGEGRRPQARVGLDGRPQLAGEDGAEGGA